MATINGGSSNDLINGTAVSDILRGFGGRDWLYGLEGRDQLEGGDGADHLFGGAGNDKLIGGAGTDVAYFTGKMADYKVVTTKSGTTVTDFKPKLDGNDGSDTLGGIERIQFSDGLIFLTPNSAPLVPSDADNAVDFVAEGATSGTLVGIQASAADTDDDDVQYSIVLADGTTTVDDGRFQIDPTTGVVSVSSGSALNYEAANSHTIVIRAADDFAAYADTSFTINVGNVAPSAPVDTNATDNVVSENALVGTSIGITAASTDPSGGSVQYYFRNAQGSATQTLGNFTINPFTGVVTVASALDYETASSHSLTIYAKDGTAESSSIFTVSVSDVQVSALDSKVFVEAWGGNLIGYLSGLVNGSPTVVSGMLVEDVTYSLTSVVGSGVTLLSSAFGTVNMLLNGGWSSYTYTMTAGNETSAPATVTLHLGAADTFIGTSGNDIFQVQVNERVEGGGGADRITVAFGASTLLGGDGNDYIYSIYGHGNVIDGGKGVDQINLTTTEIWGAGNHDSDTVILRPGEVDGDYIFGFESGTGNDILNFVGFGEGATLVYAGNYTWEVQYGDDQVEAFKLHYNNSLFGISSLDPGDYVFS